MARKPRIEFEGAFYHVIVRGNQRQKIFLDEGDFLKYLKFLRDYKEEYRFSLYAYALMPNHVHLLIETGDTPLSKILQGINQRYTMYFNWKYKTVGHLFQGRYKAILCDRDGYLLSLIRYIHYNPVRGGLVKWLEDYCWSSSHGQFIGSNTSGIADTRPVLEIFSDNLTRARRLYRKYMGEEGTASREDFYNTVDQRILGDQEFVERVAGRLHKGIVPGRRRHEYSLNQIAAEIRRVWGMSLEELKGKGKDLDVMEGRKLLALAAKEYGYKGTEIAEFLRKDPAAITKYSKDRRTLQGKLDRLFLVLRTQLNVNIQV